MFKDRYVYFVWNLRHQRPMVSHAPLNCNIAPKLEIDDPAMPGAEAKEGPSAFKLGFLRGAFPGHSVNH